MSSDADLAVELAIGAGELLLRVRSEVGHSDPRRLKDAGDRRAHDWLAAELARARPGDVVLSEEAADPQARHTADRVWIIDPLDGTREFGEPGRTDWAVHVALWERAGLPDGTDGLSTGAVALPAQGRTMSSSAPPTLPAYDGVPRVVASRSRATQLVRDVVDALGGEQIPLGSAGAKIAAVVYGEAEAYVHSGGQYEWDSAAPVAVAAAAGLHTSRLDGSPLRYNQREVYLPDLIVCRPELADAVLRVTRLG